MGNLLVYDGKNFLDKYMRFMTKDVYISRDMNEKFLDSYKYLLDEVTKEQYLYQDQVNVKRIVSIFKKSDKVVRLHNQKYLKRGLERYDSFFKELYSDDVLDKNKKLLVLVNESNMLSIMGKNYIPFVATKLAYLKQVCRVSSGKILVLCDDYKDLASLEEELLLKNIDGVKCSTLSSYRLSTLEREENYLDYSYMYKLLFSYITFVLFPDKDRFEHFLRLFSNYIYLNKDYKKFNHFKDYHSYLYQRKFEESGLSLKKFNEKEIKNRKSYLRTVKNKTVSCKEMVDVVNFLYLNSIDYEYDSDNDMVAIYSYREPIHILFNQNKKSNDDICLDVNDKKFLEKLVYELIKRRFPLELKSEQIVFDSLRDSTIDSYFCEFIKTILIPFILKLERGNNNFKDSYFSKGQLDELYQIYNYYLNYIGKHSYVDDVSLDKRVEDKINNSCYEYVIMLGDMSINFHKNCINILKEYPDVCFFKNYIKLMYEYKKYLKSNKYLLGMDTYINKEELFDLSSLFLKEHLEYLNEGVKDSSKKICVCYYEDKDRIHFSYNLMSLVYKVVDRECNRDILIGYQKGHDINYFVRDNVFDRVNKDILRCDIGDVLYGNVSSIDKYYSVVILPYLIKDVFHKDMFFRDDFVQVKMFIYMALNHCKDKLYLMCPLSRKGEYRKLFERMVNVEYFD